MFKGIATHGYGGVILKAEARQSCAGLFLCPDGFGPPDISVGSAFFFSPPVPNR